MKTPSDRQILLLGVALGAAYGVFVRYVFGLPFTSFGAHKELAHSDFFEVMTTGFIFGVPVALGAITVWFGSRRGPYPWWKAIVMPWLAALACLFSCLLLAWEGLICVILWLPLALVLSSVGGLLAKTISLFFKGDKSRLSCVAVIALAPFVVAPLESRLAEPTEIKTVDTVIEIKASPAIVWEQIRSVPRIAESEHGFSLSHLAGFPRPTEAVLEGTGVGAVRYARFEGDVLFVETITEWKDCEKLSFSIRADTKNIPPTTFDEHVTIGGPYFDVLNGTYRIERKGPAAVILHLSSDQRLSTRFNAYSHLWTEWLMADLQNYILRIVKKRCESQAAQAKPESAN